MAALAPVLAGGLIIAAGLVLSAAALHDVAFRTVPNWMSLTIAALAAVVQLLAGHAAASGLAAALVFAAAAMCWQRGWLGGGDVKLLAAAALLVPPALVIALLLRVALAGGVLAVCYLGLARVVMAPPRPRPAGLLARVWRVERFRIRRRGPLPYASAIVAGTFFVLLGQ